MNIQTAETRVTAEATDFIVQSRLDAVPAEALEIARRCIIDTVGLYVAGMNEASTRIALGIAREDGGQGAALLLGAPGTRVPAHVAARILGLAAHAHDFDDTQVSEDPAHVYGLLTHPSTAPLSATLAVGDMLGERDGGRLLAAFLTGFEVSCKISEWLKPEHYLRGHHSSGTVATFGAAASAAWLLGLDRARIAAALGIAAAMAAGVRCSFGTMSKPWHVARACENGVMAARMAERGYTGDPDALDGRWGFAQILAGGFSADKLSQGFGRTWSILTPGVSIKPYPSGILTHQAMDMVRDLVIAQDVRAEEVERIDFYAGDNILNPIRYPIAANGLQAKFSMAALLSMMVLYRDGGLARFEDAVVQSCKFQDMQARVNTHVSDKINAMGFDLIRSEVEITMKDGTIHRAEADTRYRGGPQKPFAEADLRDKFEACCAFGGIAPAETAELFEAAQMVKAGVTATPLFACLASLRAPR